MAVPQIGGTYTGRFGSTSQISIDISAIPVGAWMIVSAMNSSKTNIITTPTGWITIANEVVTGTRTNFLSAKIRSSADGSAAVFTQNTVNTTSIALLWGVGSDTVDQWVVGAQWERALNSAEPAGSRYSNVAKSVTTVKRNSLVVAISHEATLAMTGSNEIASISPSTGWAQQIWLPQVAVNDRIETIWMGTQELTSVASSGDVTVAYTSPQDSNGWGVQLAIPADETPTVIGTPTTYIGSSSTEFTITRPSGVLDGDYIVVALRGQSSTVTVAPTSPGFSRLGPAFVYSSASFRANGFYGRPVTTSATEPASYTFSFTATATNTRLVATAFIVRGVDLTTPLAGFFDNYGGTLITNGRQTDSYTLAATPALQLFAGASEFASPNNHVPVSTPAGYTVVQEVATSSVLTSSRSYIWVGAKKVTASPTGTDSITWTVASGPAAESISLRGITPPVDPAGNGYAVANGAGSAVKMYHVTANGPRTPTAVVPVRRGFNTVAQVLAKPGVTWAHRGGSVSYAEMSLYAYTQCVVRGYGVLEVSLARTSDGVWFGLHDQTTDRTSGGVYGNASSQTWAQIQAQQIVVGGQGAPQPYMRWEELVAAYGNTHVLVVDPKYGLGSYRTEFLNMVYNSLGPTKAIIKYSGPGSGAAALSTAAKAMGFETWGFFYASDASAAQGGNGNLQTWGSYWTLLGMEYGASQAIWDEALAFGKPVIGHIAPDQAAYDTAIAKGASGVQVSGVAVVSPVSWWTP